VKKTLPNVVVIALDQRVSGSAHLTNCCAEHPGVRVIAVARTELHHVLLGFLEIYSNNIEASEEECWRYAKEPS